MYLDRNFYRDPESIFAHLVEVVGGLSLVASGKKKAGVVPEEFLAKSLGWWMALCGKVGVKSVEALIWTKFPYTCPYCRETPHVPSRCKSVRQQRTSPDWDKLAEMGSHDLAKRPSNLPGWQKMYDVVYPRSDQTTHERNFSRLAEELGELAEGIRVLPIARTYFLSEVADVFAWLMGEANQMDSDKSYPGGHGAFLVDAMNTEYPERCKYCGSQLCKCPPVLQTTLGRLAHETPSSAFPGAAGELLFTVEEAREFFRVGDEEIKLAGKELSVNSELIREVLATVRPLQKLIMEQSAVQRGVMANFAAALQGVENLAIQQRLTQESVDELVSAIKSLPSERRSIVIDFLTGIGSGAFLPVLLHALGVG
jgi:NTP pyrophosphatase (non-canonical NTP hydrolase)